MLGSGLDDCFRPVLGGRCKPGTLSVWRALVWLLRLGVRRLGRRGGWARQHLWWRADRQRQGLPSGVRVNGGDVTQAVVKGPVGEEAAVLGATGHDVFRWLWRQRCGAWGLSQSLVAYGCSGPRGQNLGWGNRGLCLVISSWLPDTTLPPRVPPHSLPLAGPALSPLPF